MLDINTAIVFCVAGVLVGFGIIFLNFWKRVKEETGRARKEKIKLRENILRNLSEFNDRGLYEEKLQGKIEELLEIGKANDMVILVSVALKREVNKERIAESEMTSWCNIRSNKVTLKLIKSIEILKKEGEIKC